MKIKEVIQFLETKYPLAWQEDFDNCGLQCGNAEQEITGVLVCFEMSDYTIEEALKMGANMVISHHPLMLKNGIRQVAPVNRVGRIICKALENRMVLYAMHTNMDSAPTGVNTFFAQKLNLQNVSVLASNPANLEIGLGRVGDLVEPMEALPFLAWVKKTMGVKVLKYFGDEDKKIRRVAVCGGGGSSFIRDAIAAGADAYISGDIKYHDFHVADHRMIIADLGHLETEHFVKEIIYNELKENFTNFAVHFCEKEMMQIKVL